MALKPARLQRSDDGAIRSLDYGDVYFQLKGGMEESDYVFLQNNNLRARFESLAPGDAFFIGELGFGTGLNVLQTCALWRAAAPQGARLHIYSVEKHPVTYHDLADIYRGWPQFESFTAPLLHHYPPMVEGFHTLRLAPDVTLTLVFGDVADALPQMTGLFDCWFMDGFTPSRNAGMWDESLYPHLARLTRPGGTLTSFSSAGHVRRSLAAAGFAVKKIPGYGIKWSMTTAAMPLGEAPAHHGDPAPRRTVAVIGAGIAGCSVAHALARRGHKVTVYDRHDTCAQEASGNPVAVIYPKLTADDSARGDYYSHAFCYVRSLLDALALPSWNACGVLRLDLSDKDRAHSQKLVARRACPPDFTDWLPNTAFNKSALLHAGGGHVDPRAFCAALLDHPGITTVYNHDVADWRALGADITVIAQANASISHAETAGLPLNPLRGQVTLLAPTDISASMHKVVCHKNYLAPVVDGLHCIGATFQKEPVTDFAARREDDLENLETLNRNLPGLGFTAKDIRGARAGYRATTPDRLPMAGQVAENLYLATGFGAHGMTGAPLIGDMLAAMISGEPLPLPAALAQAFAPGRFAARHARRTRK